MQNESDVNENKKGVYPITCNTDLSFCLPEEGNVMLCFFDYKIHLPVKELKKFLKTYIDYRTDLFFAKKG